VGTQEEFANGLPEGNGTGHDLPVDVGLLRWLAAGVGCGTPRSCLTTWPHPSKNQFRARPHGT
jgi:hypothetical protein